MLRRSFEHVLFCGLVCAAAIASAEPGANLLINPGFEQGTKQTAEGWHSGVWGGARAAHGRTSEEVHEGTHSYYLEFRGGKGGLQLFPDKSAVLSEADRSANRIVVSGWYRGNANPVTIQVRYFQEEDGKAKGILDALGGRLCHTLRLPPSRAWQHVEETFTPPKRTEGMGEVGVRPPRPSPPPWPSSRALSCSTLPAISRSKHSVSCVTQPSEKAVVPVLRNIRAREGWEPGSEMQTARPDPACADDIRLRKSNSQRC